MKHKSVKAKWIVVVVLATAVLAACTVNDDPTPQTPLAEVVTVERPSATATPPPSNAPTATRSLVETAVPTSTPTPTATYLPSPTPLPPLVWSDGLNYAAHVDGFSGSTVTWSPTRNEFIATTCWNFSADRNWKIFRFVEPTFELIDITPQDFSCKILDDIIWEPNGEKILHSDTLPDDHPNKIYGEDHAIWIMNRDGNDYQPLNFDEAYGRHLDFRDWLNTETLVYEYYCGGGHDCVVILNTKTGKRLSTTIVHIGDGFQAGENYVATNTGMYFDSNTSAVAILDEIVHPEPYFAGGAYSICLSTKCGAFPCILSPCIEENSRFEDWLPGTNQMLVLTWPAEDFLLLPRNYDDRINPEVNTQLQLWDIDAEELTLIVYNAIFGRFSPDGRFLAYQTLLPAPPIPHHGF